MCTASTFNGGHAVTTELKSMFSWIRTFVAPRAAVETSEAGAHSVLDFDPAWHGDHWQNLLSSPMDARRYVMEDWAIPTPLIFGSDASSESQDAAPEASLEEELEPAN
jgi:hypothetical protein